MSLNNLFYSQKDILELLPGADKLTYNKKDQIHRLTGNVNFKYEGNPFYCDSAHYNKSQKWLKAFGNVHCIYKNEINIFCDSLFYNSITKLARLRGNVRIRDFEYKISSNSMNYDFNKKCAYYTNKGKVEGITSNEIITSNHGYIYPSSKNFFFKGNVRYRKGNIKMLSDTLQYSYSKQTAYFFGSSKIIYDSTYMTCNKGWYNMKKEEGMLIDSARVSLNSKIILGDTIHYLLKDSMSMASGNVVIRDTIKGFYSNSDEAYYFEKEGLTKLNGGVCVRKIENGDTLIIQSDTLINYEDTINSLEKTMAFNNVSFKTNEIEAICDSMVLDSSVLNLFHDPIVWSDKTEMKGEAMKIYYKDSIVDSVLISKNSSVIMEIDKENFYNQISGTDIMAIFINDTLKNAYVYGNAWTIFYPEDENKTDSSIITKRMGMNRLFSSDIRIDIDSGSIKGISYLEKPDGIFYPLNKIKSEEKFIKGFSWNPLLRPKMDICRFNSFLK